MKMIIIPYLVHFATHTFSNAVSLILIHLQ